MTARTSFPELAGPADSEVVMRMVETHWGYIIRVESGPPGAISIGQTAAGFFGLAAVAASVGFWVLPGAFFSADVALFKLGASFLTCAFGVFLLSYASDGSAYELQVDLNHNELREAMRNPKGQARLKSRHRFDDVGRVFVQREDEEGAMANLMLQIGQTNNVVVVARAPESQLTALRNRLAKDLAKPAVQTRRDPRTGNRRGAAKPRTPSPVKGAARLRA
ncbi:MAG: hypothetical protein ACC631_12445 [Halocynthiibacter sp.]